MSRRLILQWLRRWREGQADVAVALVVVDVSAANASAPEEVV